MKALAITIIFTLIFALGLVQNVQAQASASVSYTIVVTEDMLAGRGNDRGMDMTETREYAPQTSVAVRMHDVKSANQELPAFEADISPEDSPAIANMLAENLKPAVTPEAETADVQTDRFQEEDGEYLVVMEFN